jgi:hypothetical protein
MSPLGFVGYVFGGCEEWCDFSCECMTLSGDHLIFGGLFDFPVLYACGELDLHFVLSLSKLGLSFLAPIIQPDVFFPH